MHELSKQTLETDSPRLQLSSLLHIKKKAKKQKAGGKVGVKRLQCVLCVCARYEYSGIRSLARVGKRVIITGRSHLNAALGRVQHPRSKI